MISLYLVGLLVALVEAGLLVALLALVEAAGTMITSLSVKGVLLLGLVIAPAVGVVGIVVDVVIDIDVVVPSKLLWDCSSSSSKSDLWHTLSISSHDESSTDTDMDVEGQGSPKSGI